MLCLIGQKLFSETTFITKEEMPPKPGDLIGFKFLNVFSNSLSCRILSPKHFFWGSYKFLKIFWSMCNRRCQFRTNFCKKYYWIHLQFYFDQNIRCRKLAFGKAIIDNFVWPVVSYVFLILSSQSFLGIFSPRLQIMICIPFFRWHKFSFSKVYHNFLLFLWIFEDLLSCKDLERFLLWPFIL